MGHLDKSGAACLTFVWLLSRVDAGVRLEVGWSVELGTTDVAVVRLRTSVNGLVACKVALVAEGGLAAVTLVWLVTVDLDHVVFQGIFLYKLGVTPVAEVGVVFTSGGGVL